MDYCSSCRRHLNGALVCPGCGAYAPDIAPPATDGRIGSGAPPATPAHRESATSGVWHDRPLDNEAEFHADTDAAPHTLAADVEGPSPAQQGRAARRRQLARWKKNKRRAAVASAVALVGGGLTIATMDRHSTDRAQAATAPDQRSVGAVEEQMPEQNPPASTPATTQGTLRSSHTPSQSQPQPPTTSAPRQQSLAAPPRTPQSIARPDAAAPPRPAASSTPQPQSTAASAGESAPERSDTTTEQPSAPPTAGSPDSGASQTGPALISTSPTEVCVLVVCLG
ncbi:SCO2400 family protein [Streptomyces sp. SYSU K21746]